MSSVPPSETDDAFLGGKLQILQPRAAFRAGIDAVLLAASVSAAPAAGPRVLDAGAGVGVAGLCLARRLPPVRVTLAERSPELAALARRNVDRNGLSDRVAVAEADLLGAPAHLDAAGLRAGAFDIVLTNPPWLETGRGRPSSDPIKADANAMPEAALEAWMRFAARVTAPGGLLVLLHRADALDRVLAALARRFGGLEILPIHPRRGEPAHRILVKARKGSRAPLSLLPGLVLHDDGGFTPEVEAVLRTGAALPWPGRL